MLLLIIIIIDVGIKIFPYIEFFLCFLYNRKNFLFVSAILQVVMLFICTVGVLVCV